MVSQVEGREDEKLRRISLNWVKSHENFKKVKITALYSIGHGNKMHARREKPEGGSVQACNEAMKDVFARFCKKMVFQVCIIHNCVFCLYNSLYSIDMPCKVSTNKELIHIADRCLFFADKK
jgi:hypothetical protein